MELTIVDGLAYVTARFALPDNGIGEVKVKVTVEPSDSLQQIQSETRPLMLAGLRRAISVLEEDDRAEKSG